MSSFSRFQDINQKRGIANQKTNSSFILKGYPSIIISGLNDLQVEACIVNKQEDDKAYIYTHLNDQLTIGSVWSAKGLHWLISEEIIIIKDVNWRKYTALLCNVEIDGIWGYFIGPEKSYINVTLKQNHILQTQSKPILVMPTGFINIQDKIRLKNRSWLVQEEDNLSTPGLSYYSLRADTINKKSITPEITNSDIEKDTTVTPIIKPSDPELMILRPNELIQIETENGYFKVNNAAVEIKSIEEKLVSFIVPFGINEVKIQIKIQGRIQEYTLRQEM